ncbi:MAG: Maf family protein [Nitrososphaera sp.]|nr:Maf family protein [Nitrososphaera sp.]
MIHKVVLSLASNSPRRRQLISLGGWMFHVTPVSVDETPYPGENPRAYVIRLATAKVLAAANTLRPDSVAVAADTTVVDGNEILGKPNDASEAIQMLQRLRGHAHQVFTAIAILSYGSREPIIDVCMTTVPMRDYSNEEIFAYVATGDPFDKAGAYAIQHPRFRPVASMDGCFANVVGLPLCHLTRTLEKTGIVARADVSRNCQRKLQYDCPI